MRRRQTLSSLGSRMNRPSLTRKAARPRMSMGVQQERRGSYQPRRRSSVASRRSSVYGSSSSAKDTRPLKDRSFQHHCIKMLIHFLTERGYDQPISQKLLTRPTGRDFYNIAEFLVKCIDPRFQFKGRIEDELPICFKALKYPFAISKTALQAVGTPHTWPPLLAALAWFVELLQYDEAASKTEESEGFEGESADKLFYQYLSNAYTHFLSGDDEMAEQLDQEVAASFDERNKELAEEIAAQVRENEELRKQIAEATSEESSIPTLTKKKAELLMDVSKFEELIERLEKHKADQSRRLEAKHADIATKRDELAKLEKQIEQLEVRLENQELSAADVQHMAKEKAMLKESIARVETQRAAAQEALWEVEMAVTKEMDTLNGKVNAYHQAATSLHLLPDTAKYANGVDFEIRLAPVSDRGGELLATDIRGHIKDSLRKLKAEFTTRRFQGLTSCDDLNDTVSERRQAFRKAQDEISQLEARLSRMDEDFRNEKTDLERQLAIERDEMETLEAEIDRTREAASEEAVEDAGLSAAALDDAEAELAALRESLLKQREAVRAKIHSALDYLTEHKGYVNEQLGSLLAQVTEKRNSIKAQFAAPLAC